MEFAPVTEGIQAIVINGPKIVYTYCSLSVMPDLIRHPATLEGQSMDSGITLPE
jgi:hypothetical protein